MAYLVDTSVLARLANTADPFHVVATHAIVELHRRGEALHVTAQNLVEFRNKGIFYEAITNQILDDLVGACAPRRMTVIGDFSARGGISTTVTATYQKPAV